MRPSFMTPMQRMQGWRLWMVFTIATVIVAEVIVSVMSIVLKGEICGDCLVVVGAVVPVSLALPSHMLEGFGLPGDPRRHNPLLIRVHPWLKYVSHDT